jgi:hypothetical protein
MKYQLKGYLAYSGSYYLTHPWEFFSDWFKEVKAFFQRGWRGYADSDLWGFDWYLNLILANGLKQFSKHIHSYPGYGGANSAKKWKAIITKMQEGFQAVEDYENKGFEKDKNGAKMKVAYAKQLDSLKLMTKWFGHLWD